MASSIFSRYQYLEPNDGEALKQYVYRGTDKSYILKYVFRPMNYFLIQYVPSWIAPNLITVSGLLATIFAHIVIAFYIPEVEDLEDTTPRWVYLLCAVTLFLYQTLDNLDGLQARNTGTSSPLGVLFDHGCDALNCTVGALTLASTLQCGPTWKTWIMTLNVIAVFFMNTWEEFYRGELVIPVINGANEGILSGVGMYVLTYFAGPHFWRQTVSVPMPHAAAHWFDSILGALPRYQSAVAELNATGTVQIQYNTLVVFFMTICMFFTVLTHIGNVYQAIQSGCGHGLYTKSYMVRNHPFLHALTRIAPLVILIAMANVWLFVSPSRIFTLHPRLCAWTIGLLFAKLVTHLMLAHVCSREYHPVRKTLVPMLYLGCHTAFQIWNARPVWSADKESMIHIDEELILYEFFALSSITYFHLVVCVVWEMAKLLDIGIFRIIKKKKVQ